jgi:hypothetical protein
MKQVNEVEVLRQHNRILQQNFCNMADIIKKYREMTKSALNALEHITPTEQEGLHDIIYDCRAEIMNLTQKELTMINNVELTLEIRKAINDSGKL